MKYSAIFFLAAFLLTRCFDVFANDSAYVRFDVDTQLKTRNFSIVLSDGINEHQINLQKSPDWHGILNSPFGYIKLSYSNSDSTYIGKQLFFNSGISNLKITYVPNGIDYFKIDEDLSTNIVSYKKMGGAVLDSLLKDIADESHAFIMKNRMKLAIDTILRHALALVDSLKHRKVEFIKQFPSSYLSFWIFQNEIVRSDYLRPDSLLKFYNSILSDKYKNSKAAEYLVDMIQNKIAVISNKVFPDFSVVDIQNRKLELAKLRGRYVLIQIWASWCVPCIEELPALKKINERYKQSMFTFISFSIDKDSSAFRRAVAKYSMDWVQVFGDLRLYNSLAEVPIPQLYLLDPSGRTIYSRKATRDFSLMLLQKLLSEKLN